MRVLVIGGTKFIGLHVVKRLHELGHQVTVFHRGQTDNQVPEGVAHIYGDRQDLPAFAEQFKQLSPDVVIHNILATEEQAQTVVDTFRGIAGRLVAISSQDVYRGFGLVNKREEGELAPLPITEDSELRRNLYPYRGLVDSPIMYNYDKILVERTVMSEPELPCTVLRLPAVYGPFDPQRRLFEFVKRMDDNRPFLLLEEGFAKWKWSRSYVENVAEAIVMAVLDPRAAGRIYNVAEPQTISTEELVQEIARITGWQGEVLVVPNAELPEGMRNDMNTDQHVIVDSSRIRAELGFEERVPFDEGLQRTIAWERANPPSSLPEGAFDYAAEDAVAERVRKYS